MHGSLFPRRDVMKLFPFAIAELARLAVKAKSETARIAAIRELLDRGYGRPRQAVEVSAPAGDPLQELFEMIDALNRKRPHQRRVGYFLCEWSTGLTV